MKTTMRLFLLFCAVFMASQPVLAQNDEDTRNKAVITTDDGDRQLITDEISVIRFDGPKVTVVQPWGETVFDRTLRNLTFLRPLPGTLRLTVNVSKDDHASTTRGHELNGDGYLLSTWSADDRVYVYDNVTTDTPIGTLTPETTGDQVSKMSGNINADDLSEGTTLYLSTQPRTYSYATQTGDLEASGIFYLTTTAEVTSIKGGNATTADATFALAQAIVRFTLEDGSNNAVSAKKLVITDGASTITVTPTSATNVLFVAMPAAASTAYSLTATDNSGREWTGSKTATLGYGYYRTTVTMTKTKLTPSVTAPTALSPTYTGSAQALVNEGSTTGGTLYYIATSTNSAPDINAAGWATAIPTGTNAGTYYVWTKVTGNADYNDAGVSATSVEVTIGQATNSFTTQPTITGWTYGSAANAPTGGVVEFGEIVYKYCATAAGTYDTYANVVNGQAGTWYVKGFVEATTNYAAAESNAVEFTISAAGSIGYATTAIEKTIGDAAFINPLTKTGDGNVTYARSSGDDICTVNATTGQVTLKGTAGSCTITATVTNSATYIYATTTANYTLTVKTMLQTPLTFEAMTAGAKVTFWGGEGPFGPEPASVAIEYSQNGGEWETYTEAITLSNVGDKVSFRGDNTSYWPGNKFSCSDDCYIYGNIMSLVSKEGYATATTLTGSYAFSGLFSENSNIFNHASKTLVLPATTLSSSCYSNMFNGCTGLTTAPELPAETMAEYCYYNMFNGCTGLTTAPELPAETLAEGCYYNMFNGCTGLITAPALPATTLYDYCYTSMFYRCTSLEVAPSLPAMTMKLLCYDGMFSGCTSMTVAPALPATTLAYQCYEGMFSGCTSLATAPELPATSLAGFCYDGMFSGCTSLTTAPVLPATTLIQYCYQYMFQDCSNLNSVTCLATDITASNCTNGWLSGVATNGTFYKPALADWSGKTGSSGIPSGWTVLPVGALPGQFSVSASKKVYFSKGNLQLTAANTWKFADNQYDYFGGSQSDNHRDLFGWGTGNNPNQTSTSNSDYGTFTEWGNNSDLQSSLGTGWRTLTKEEWTYLFNNRSTTSGVRYAKATVNGKSGVILLPDDWSTSYYNLESTNTPSAAFDANIITSDNWNNYLAAYGAVFLPAAGSRSNSSVSDVGSYGYYWSSSPHPNDTGKAYRVLFNSINYSEVNTANSSVRNRGCSVRLVRDVTP